MQPINLAAGIATLFTVASLHAQTWTWDGSEGNNSWNNGGNWSPGVAPPNNGTATIIFGTSPRDTPDLTLPWHVHGVIFDTIASFNIFGYDLISTAGNTLTIGAGGIAQNADNRQTISHAITLSAAQTWSVTRFALYIPGAVQNGGNLLTIDGAKGNSGVEIFGVISGSGGLNKNGPGILYLDGPAANTYSGTTTVNSGILILDKSFDGITAIPGTLIVGDGVGTTIDRVQNNKGNQIADGATVSIFPTGAWRLVDGAGTSSETISFLNISSTGIAGGGLVTLDNGTVTVLGNVTMTGGMVGTSGAGTLALSGSLTTNATNITASISTQLDLGGGARIFTIADGAAPIDLNVTGGVSNGAIHFDGPGALRLGAANTYAGGTTLNGGTILIGHNSALGVGPLTSNGGTLRADGAARTIANAVTGSDAVVDGTFDLTLNGAMNLTGGITKNGSGALTFAEAAVISGALVVNTGIVGFSADFAAGNGLTNSATVLIGEQTLTVNGTGINNQGPLTLTGGTLAGSGPIVNDSLLSGSGTIGGTGGFTNNAALTVSGGILTLGNAGANTNAGNVAVAAGLQLRLTGGTLANTGTVDLVGGIVAGTATLSNNAGGTMSGRGTITAPLANSGGMLRAQGGTLNVMSAFTNSGVVRVDNGAGLAGGAITNTGRIEGDGTISNAVTNTAAGTIRAEAGKTLYFAGGGAPNAGAWNLQGGALDFAGVVTNGATGFISGRGTLYTDGLTNSGQMAFSGGTTDLLGDVTNAVGGRIGTSGAGTTTFFDDVVHNGTEIRTSAGASTVFFGSVSGAAPFTGTGTVFFEGDLRPGNSSGSLSIAPQAVLTSSNTVTVEIGGLTAGTQHDKVNFSSASTPQVVWDGTLRVSLINGFTPAAGQSFDVFDFDNTRAAGTFAAITLPVLPTGLAWDTSQLHTDGTLSVISTAGLTFAQWAATALGIPAATPTGDHDNDGWNNATEFALGLQPPQPGTVFPHSNLHTYAEGERLRLLFTRPLDRTGITLRVQASSHLVTWTDVAVSVDSAPFTGAGFITENRSHPLNEPGLVEVRDIVNVATAPRRLMRLRIEIAP